jgi:hypothetical protein
MAEIQPVELGDGVTLVLRHEPEGWCFGKTAGYQYEWNFREA